MQKNILIISNGYGEDQIACNLIRALQAKHPASHISPLPLVGPGLEYKKLNLTPVLKNKEFPSGGFVRNFKNLFLDLKTGLLHHLIHQLIAIKKHAKNTDLAIAVGDVFCLIMAKLFNKNPVYFLPTAKSDLFMSHSFLEKWLIKKLATKTFTRDQVTANSLQKSNINAFYLGNPMMDNMPFAKDTFKYLKTDLILGILPGSRQEAYKNLTHIFKIIEILHTKNPAIKYLLSLPPTLTICPDDLPPHIKIIITNKFYDLLYASKIILGLAGTANEQAIHLGKKVYCFPGFGPQTTAQRFQEQQKLLGPDLIFLPHNNPASIAQTLLTALNQTSKASAPIKPHNLSASLKIVQEILN
jgi:hypothetical protein